MGVLRSLNRMCQLFGLDVARGAVAAKSLPVYFRDLLRFKRLLRQSNGGFEVTKLYPCLFDRHEESGNGSSQYFLQDLYVASRVFQNNPRHHVDVGSRIDGFVAHVASYRELEVIDVRSLSPLPFHVKFLQADVSSEQFGLKNYCDSVSCLHALEHFGLGRYGDPLDPDGHKKGLANMHRMLHPGGRLYLSVPIGSQRIEFNAHRIFAVAGLLNLFQERFRVIRFSLIDDSCRLFIDLPLDATRVAENFGCIHGCGVFEAQKI